LKHLERDVEEEEWVKTKRRNSPSSYCIIQTIFAIFPLIEEKLFKVENGRFFLQYFSRKEWYNGKLLSVID
jgi:hypothetical protein